MRLPDCVSAVIMLDNERSEHLTTSIVKDENTSM